MSFECSTRTSDSELSKSERRRTIGHTSLQAIATSARKRDREGAGGQGRAGGRGRAREGARERESTSASIKERVHKSKKTLMGMHRCTVSRISKRRRRRRWCTRSVVCNAVCNMRIRTLRAQLCGGRRGGSPTVSSSAPSAPCRAVRRTWKCRIYIGSIALGQQSLLQSHLHYYHYESSKLRSSA